MSLVTSDYENYSYSIFFDDLVKLKSRQLWKRVGTIKLHISDKKKRYDDRIRPHIHTTLYHDASEQ